MHMLASAESCSYCARRLGSEVRGATEVRAATEKAEGGAWAMWRGEGDRAGLAGVPRGAAARGVPYGPYVQHYIESSKVSPKVS